MINAIWSFGLIDTKNVYNGHNGYSIYIDILGNDDDDDGDGDMPAAHPYQTHTIWLLLSHFTVVIVAGDFFFFGCHGDFIIIVVILDLFAFFLANYLVYKWKDLCDVFIATYSQRYI